MYSTPENVRAAIRIAFTRQEWQDLQQYSEFLNAYTTASNRDTAKAAIALGARLLQKARRRPPVDPPHGSCAE